MELVTGAKRLGFPGVLLAVAFPVRSCNVPLPFTCWKGRMKVRSSGVEATFDICDELGPKSICDDL